MDLTSQEPLLLEGRDYYIDAATRYMVFTGFYLEKRGYCCGNGCRHCPYDPPFGGQRAKLSPNKGG